MISNASTTGRDYPILYLSFLNGTPLLSKTKKKSPGKREREDAERGAATKASHALSVTKQESRGITDATIITYEQHIA